MDLVSPQIYGAIVLLNVAGLGVIAYLLTNATIAGQRDSIRKIDANTAAVNRIVRMWALWLVTERREIPEKVRAEARELLEEAREAGPDPHSGG